MYHFRYLKSKFGLGNRMDGLLITDYQNLNSFTIKKIVRVIITGTAHSYNIIH